MTTNLLIGYPDIPYRGTQTSNLTGATGYGLDNVITGTRGEHAKALATTSDHVYFQYDLGASVTASSNYFALARADILRGKNAQVINLRGSRRPYNQPLSTASTVKGWFDPNRGVTVDANNRVSQWNDLSGLGYHFTQSVDAQKPILSRADNKENLFTYSEQFNNAIWNATRVTVTANATANIRNGDTTADEIKDDGSAATTHYVYQNFKFISGKSYVFSVYAKQAVGTRSISLRLDNTAFTASTYAHFNLGTGAVTSTSGGTSASSITDMGGGWYLCSMTAPAIATSTQAAIIYLSNPAATTAYNGDSTSSIYLDAAQLRQSTADSTYVKTVAGIEYRGVNGNRTLIFDGVDDSLLNTSIANLVSGTDLPLSMIAVYDRTMTGGTGAVFSLGNGSTGPMFVAVEERGGSLRVRKTDNAVVTVDVSGGTTTSTGNYIEIVTHTGTATNAWNNNTQWATAAAQNVGICTFDATHPTTIGAIYDNSAEHAVGEYTGVICECIFYDTQLSGTDVTALYEYLADKWQTARLAGTGTLDTDTLYGAQSRDIVSNFTASTAYRYYYTQIGNPSQTAIDYEHSKQYFGTGFDMGRDPLYSRVFRRDARYPSARDGAVIIELEWEGITDAIRNSFYDKIVKYKDVNPVYLYTTSYHDVLQGMRGVHCRLVSCDMQTGRRYDTNRIKCTFEEVI